MVSKQTQHRLAAHGKRIASKKLTQFALHLKTELDHLARQLLFKLSFLRQTLQA
jgi:hypothetical protein